MAALQCIFCVNHQITTLSAKCAHVSRRHNFTMRANLQRFDSAYLDPIARGYPYCDCCHLYLEDVETLRSHGCTQYHKDRVSAAGLSGAAPPVRAGGMDDEGGGGGGSGEGGSDEGGSEGGGSGGGGGSDGADWFGPRDDQDAPVSDEEHGAHGGGAEEAGRAYDWLSRPLDELNFDGDQRIGEVVLLPLMCDDWDTDEGLLVGYLDPLSYSRYRIVDIDPVHKVHDNIYKPCLGTGNTHRPYR